MGYTVNFTENQSVTADDLNAVAYGLTEDSTSFSDGKLYGIKDLNAISKAIITKGVSSGCNVSLRSGSVFISQGIAYFDDGKKITIDTGGITLSRESTTEKNYVWLSNDDITGQVSAKCTKASPDGDCVKLAEISKSGVVTQTKDIAKMKNSSMLPNFYREPITFTLSPSSNSDILTETIDIGDDFKRMVVTSNRALVYLDWERMVGYRVDSDDKLQEYDLTAGPGNFGSMDNVVLLPSKQGCSIWFVSYEENILTVETRNSGSGTFTIYCM
ncbi:MAG: hypothetical protein E7407_03735 [Ruminococcaceae bacterium]|nr:hypothetical protein [Oscillospiraceae bacterium]